MPRKAATEVAPEEEEEEVKDEEVKEEVRLACKIL